MKDYSQYHYMDLYDMLNHINPYKYPERIKEVEKELELRKESGEIPERLVPKIDLTRKDFLFVLKSFGLLVYTLFLSFLGYILLNSLFKDGQFSGIKDFFFAFNTFLTVLAIIELKFSGKVKYLKYILPIYLVSSLLAFGFIVGFDELAMPF